MFNAKMFRKIKKIYISIDQIISFLDVQYVRITFYIVNCEFHIQWKAFQLYYVPGEFLSEMKQVGGQGIQVHLRNFSFLCLLQGQEICHEKDFWLMFSKYFQHGTNFCYHNFPKLFVRFFSVYSKHRLCSQIRQVVTLFKKINNENLYSLINFLPFKIDNNLTHDDHKYKMTFSRNFIIHHLLAGYSQENFTVQLVGT